MKPGMQEACSDLTKLLAAYTPTAGMYVHVHGDHLTMGRCEPFGPNGETEYSDRVRLTRLARSSYGLSVKRHTGRWERTPFSGTMEEMVEVIAGLMQHLVVPFA